MTIWRQIEDFIRDLQRSLAPEVPPQLGGLMFSQASEGTLFLNPKEAADFSCLVSGLVKEFVKAEDLSRRTVERYLQHAIFDALDLQQRQLDSPFDERLSQATKELRRQITEKGVQHKCFVPVCGIDKADLPRSFGNARFVTLNDYQVQRLVEAAGGHSDVRRQVLEGVRRSSSWDDVAAIVDVYARDFGAAQHLARHEMRRTLDVLNFFAKLVPSNHGWAYLPGEAVRVVTGSPVLRHDGALSGAVAVAGPIHRMSLERVLQEEHLRPAIRRAHNLMKKTPRTELVDNLLTSLEWAGRAAVEPKREQAFLLFAIALETIVLADAHTELSYRLSTRIPHLLTHDRSARKKLSVKLKDLYRKRSKIVHTGSYEVTDEDLGYLRAVATQTILRILLHRTIRRFTTAGELKDWFEQKLLG